MSNTLSVRLPSDLLERVRRVARKSGLPVGRVVRESLESTLSNQKDQSPWRKYAGVIKGGPPDVSSRKGFSRR
ncbi:MAG: ribbon-helix-helix protein, CopG family [Terriglobales bacterium]